MAKTSLSGGNAHRQWLELLRYLSSTGMGRTQDDIAQRFGVSNRAVRKWLRNLRDIGAPLCEETDSASGRKWFRMEAGSKWPDVVGTLSVSNMMALGLARGLFETMNMSQPDVLPLEESIAPLVKGLPDHLRRDLLALVDRFHARLPSIEDTRAHGDTLETVSMALISYCCLKIHYRPQSGESKTRIIQPYRMTFLNGSFYIWGVICSDTGKRRRERWGPSMFKVTRIQDVELTDFYFKPDRDILGTIMKLEGELFGPYHDHDVRDYVIHVSPDAVEFIRPYRWHVSQRFEPRSDGGLIMTMRCAGWPMVKQWLLGFGAFVTLVEPVDLAAEMKKEIVKMAARYTD